MKDVHSTLLSFYLLVFWASVTNANGSEISLYEHNVGKTRDFVY